jgi:hypothetical protein
MLPLWFSPSRAIARSHVSEKREICGVVTACNQRCKTKRSLGIKSRASVRRFVKKRFDLFRLTPSDHQGSCRGAAGRKYFYVDGPEFIDAKPARKIIDDALAAGRPK